MYTQATHHPNRQWGASVCTVWQGGIEPAGVQGAHKHSLLCLHSVHQAHSYAYLYTGFTRQSMPPGSSMASRGSGAAGAPQYIRNTLGEWQQQLKSLHALCREGPCSC